MKHFASSLSMQQHRWTVRLLLVGGMAGYYVAMPWFSPNAPLGHLFSLPYALLWWWNTFFAWSLYDRVVLTNQNPRRFWVGLAVVLAFLTFSYSLGFGRGAFWSVLLPLLLSCNFRFNDGVKVMEGRFLQPYQKTKTYYESQRAQDDAGILWGGIRLPSSLAVKNLMVAGAVGSGKSISLQLFLQDTVRHIRPGSGKRALIHDANRDGYSQLVGMGVAMESIHILNPFDARCTAWHMAVDITTESEAESLAEILIAKEEKEDPIWRNWAVDLVKGVVECFNITAPHDWDLRDIVLATETESALRMVLAASPETTHYLEVLRNERLAQNIIATLRAKMRQYRTIAALWHYADNRISLEGWLRGSSILLLGKDNKAKEGLSALNRLLFKRAQQLLLDQPQQPLNTFVILDEVASIGKLDGLSELCTEGRKFGVCIALAFQSYAQLQEIYGEKVSEYVIGQFENKAILRLNDEVTAEWASKLIGDVQLRRHVETINYDGMQKAGRSVGDHIEIKRAVLPAEFLSILPVNFATGQGLDGYYLGHYVYRMTYSIPVMSRILFLRLAVASGFRYGQSRILPAWG
jgi:hypothetical protein